MDPSGTASVLLDWFGRHARDLPWRRTTDPYAIWVSEIMLQQTQVRTVIPYWERWLKRFPDVATLAAAAIDDVLKHWEGLGYYRRARHLQAAAQAIVARHGGRFPGTYDDVLALPGIGRYTAGAICSIAFGQPTPVLDGNVIRVLTRFDRRRGDPRRPEVSRALWQRAEEWVLAAARDGRPGACGDLNQAVMELGATVCLPRQPACEACPLEAACAARQGRCVEDFPETPARPRTTARHYVTFVASSRGCFGVRQRPVDAVNGGFWEFPGVEIDGVPGDVADLVREVFGARAERVEPWGELRHAITRYRIRQLLYRVEFRRHPRRMADGVVWRPAAALTELAFTGAHRRVVRRLAGATGKGTS